MINESTHRKWYFKHGFINQISKRYFRLFIERKNGVMLTDYKVHNLCNCIKAEHDRIIFEFTKGKLRDIFKIVRPYKYEELTNDGIMIERDMSYYTKVTHEEKIKRKAIRRKYRNLTQLFRWYGRYGQIIRYSEQSYILCIYRFPALPQLIPSFCKLLGKHEGNQYFVVTKEHLQSIESLIDPFECKKISKRDHINYFHKLADTLGFAVSPS